MKTISPNVAQLRMLVSLKNHPWMIRPDAVSDYALSALEAAEKSSDQNRADGYWEQFYTLRQGPSIDSDGIGHVEVRGALLNKAPSIYEKLGLVTRYSTITAETESLVRGGAKAILYHVDSPGGTVSGVIEGGESIKSAGVPTGAFCYGLTCSAAYWLASGASTIIATPSASVGNIGAIISWADCDAFWEEMGVTFKALVSEGADLKSTFHLEPDASQLAFLQESIDDAGKAFRDHVSEGRKAAGATLDDEVWRAGWYSGDKAESLGLVDGIGNLQGAIAHLKTFIR